MDMGKLNSNKSPTYKNVLIAAAIFLQAEMFRYFPFILAFLGAVLATDANFCTGWGCFFLPPTWHDPYFVRWQASSPLHLSPTPSCRNWWNIVSLVLLLFCWLSVRWRCLQKPGVCQRSYSTSEPDPSAAVLFSSDQATASVFHSKNVLFREPGRVLTSMEPEMDVVPYVSWKHVAVSLQIM